MSIHNLFFRPLQIGMHVPALETARALAIFLLNTAVRRDLAPPPFLERVVTARQSLASLDRRVDTSQATPILWRSGPWLSLQLPNAPHGSIKRPNTRPH